MNDEEWVFLYELDERSDSMSKKKSESAPVQSWIVYARVEVIREYVMEACTEQEAREGFEDISVAEEDVDTIRVEFISIEPNV